MKRRNILLLVLVFMITSLIILYFTAYSDHVQFYKNSMFRGIDKNLKIAVKNIYREHSASISKIIMSQDTISCHCVRFAFISDNELSAEIQLLILSKLSEYREANEFFPPDAWEVFFIKQEALYSAYVSQLKEEYFDLKGEERYTIWEEVLRVDEWLTYEMLEEMLFGQGLFEPMYRLSPSFTTTGET